jgi:hypothetical protein
MTGLAVAVGRLLLHQASPAKLFFHYSNCFKLVKYENDTS